MLRLVHMRKPTILSKRNLILPPVHRIVPIWKNHHMVPIGSIGSTLAIIVFFDQQTTPMWSAHGWYHVKKKKSISDPLMT